MSEPVLRTHTERCRDQRRIETLEAELAAVEKLALELAANHEQLLGAYNIALEALANALEWRALAAMYAISAGLVAVLLLRWLSP